ncbi:MAG: radical SAM domain-containing protein [Dehalococcoidia bacterium]
MRLPYDRFGLGVVARLRREWARTRPVQSERQVIMQQRWADLPDSARTPGQMIGRFAVGCEGTHGVFPKCNLTCSPCYHSADANKVRTDGRHTLEAVTAQMRYLRARRGERGHAQLIGGEVTLLRPDDHAAVLQAMRDAGREPMSMTHGDFDYDYLEKLATGPDGRRRFTRLSMAGHFDSLMRGRRGIPRPTDELQLTHYRRRFVEMFERLKHEHGVAAYLAHNMTVTPSNVDQVEAVTSSVMSMGYSMLSFQPAAFVGDRRRWKEGFRELTQDDVWAEVERGVGARLPHSALQMGDPRCNRTTYGFMVGARFVPFLDDLRPADLRTRDVFLERLTGVVLGGVPLWVAAGRLARVVGRHPSTMAVAVAHGARLASRAGGVRALLRGPVRPMTFVMHSFMDASEVAPAWELLQAGTLSDHPDVRAVQERLQACVYAMAHPERDLLVPACVQHSVLDPDENQRLRVLLPIVDVVGPRENVPAA